MQNRFRPVGRWRLGLAMATFAVLMVAAASTGVLYGQQACPCSLWTLATTPGPVANDAGAVELGMKFQSDSGGYITGLRFYKYSQNTGTHIGNLWTTGGTNLGNVVFSNETASGWQSQAFAAPIAIAANTTYLVSYHTNTGFYAATNNGFTSAVDNSPLHALASAGAGGNGVYQYGASSAFPSQTFSASNYWVAPVFVTSLGPDTTPPTVTGTAPAAGATGVSTAASLTSTFNEPLDPATVSSSSIELRDSSNALVPATVSYSGVTQTATIDPTPTLTNSATYTATIKSGAAGVKDVAGNALVADYVWSFTTAAAVVCPCSIWTTSTTPGPLVIDAAAVELGMKFRSDIDGLITGVRFYKYSQNTGTHVGSLWTIGGSNLGSIAFSGESASGWQQALFTTPISITAGTTYVISYHTNTGFYADTQNGFAAAIDNAPLHALADSGVNNGVYVYGANPTFPNQTWQASNYWVDPIFTTAGDTTAPTVSVTAPAGGANLTGTTVSVTATAADNVGVVGVQFKLDGANLGAEDTTSPYGLTWDTTTTTNGSHTLTAVARDAAGNTTTSAGVAVTVTNDTTAPTVSVTAPAGGANLTGTSVSVTATAADNVGVVGVQFKLDGAILGAEDTASPYGLTWDTTTTINGSHTLTAVARDAAGNTTTSAGVTVTVTNDTTAPTVSVTAPAGGANLTGTTVSVTATAADNVGVVGVQFKLDGAILGAEDTASPYGLTWDTATTTNGSHTLTAVARDAAGNTTTSAGVAVTVTNDTTAPTVSVTAPTSGATVTGTTVSLTATAADNVGVAGVQFKLDGANLGAEDTTSPYSLTWDTTTASDGSHSVTAVARDAAGNTTTSAGVPVTVSNNASGTLSIDVVAFKDVPVFGSSMTTTTFTTTAPSELLLAFVTASDASGPNTVTGVTGGGLTWQLVLRTNTQPGTSEVWRAFSTNVLTGASVTATLSHVAAGSLTVVSFRGADPSGTSGSGAIGATKSASAASGAPSASVNTTRNNSWVFGAGNDWDQALARTLGANQTMVHQFLSSVGDTFWVQRTTATTPVSGTAVTINDTAPTADRYNLTVLEVLPTTDVAPPTLSVTSPASGAIVAGTAVALAATASDNVAVVGVQFKLDGANLGSEDTTSPYSATWNTTSTTSGGHTLSATARDTSGNLTTVNVAVVVDNIAPTVTVTSPAAAATVAGTAVTVSANAADNVGVAGVQYKLDGVNLGAEVTSAPFSLVWNTQPSVDGSHTMSAVARDASSNSTTSSVITFTVNNPPTVTGTSPADTATNVATNTFVTVAFREPMDPSSISASTVTLRDAGGQLVSASVGYDISTRTATLIPAVRLANNSVYTGTVASSVRDVTGLTMAANATWTFTTGVVGCPCSIWTPWATVGSMNVDSNSVEVGLQFKADTNGLITGVRFFKYPENIGPHVGSLWTAGTTGDGLLLGSVVFTNESAWGWQEATFATPIAITANTTYVVSYFSPSGYYASTTGGLVSSVDNVPLHALSNADGGGNGLYRYAATSSYPNQTFGSSNYWVDVVFNPGASESGSPMVTSITPADEAAGVATTTTVTATFSEAIDATTVTTTTFSLRNASNVVVPSTVSYNASSLTATLTPNAALANAASYTATLTTGIKDKLGNVLAAGGSWTFTTATATLPPTSGAGGPILVVTSNADPFSQYYLEILRAEGFNAFAAIDISAMTASALSSYDVVILSSQTLTNAQTTTLSNWVTGGGNLIAMRPDSKLSTLLGISSAGTTLSNKYLLINTSQAPGAGLVNQTIQFHDTADAYLPAGAATVATLYSDATTATPYPAVTSITVGANGGHAAAFTYDLARSVVYSRQGNPAWVGQDRDALAPTRSNDLFFGEKAGDLQPNWVDLDKVSIPQADEQQRLLVNLIQFLNASRKPLPRFWYLPFGKKAAVVMTGDDHASGGTSQRFDHYMALSPAGCSVENWNCVRSTSNVYPATSLTDAKLATYIAEGFELALHVTMDPATQFGCGVNFTAATLSTAYTTQLALFNAKWPSAGGSTTNRMHCLTWSDWSTQPTTELANGIRLDTSYYYWPGNWVVGATSPGSALGMPGAANRPGFMTASGFPMRFASSTGQLIDVYQAATQMTDESGQVYPGFAVTMMDNAVGANGYYGVFTANMHTDLPVSAGSDAIIIAAQARGIPVVSARQMLKWLDGRNSSTITGTAWSANALTFTVTPGANTSGLQMMIPATSGALQLSSVTLNSTPVAYTLQTVKGVQYAFVTVGAGQYRATYVP